VTTPERCSGREIAGLVNDEARDVAEIRVGRGDFLFAELAEIAGGMDVEQKLRDLLGDFARMRERQRPRRQ
jgi:hypothetical protein